MFKRNRQVRSIADIPRDRPVWLYGAGSLGMRLLDELGPDRVAGFIDRQSGRTLRDKPVLGLDEYLRSHSPEDVIVISSSYSREIQGELDALGVANYLDAGRLPAFEWMSSGLADDLVCQFAKTHLRPTDIIFDVGANCGFTAGYFSSLAAKVCAFEPEPEAISNFLNLWYDDDKVFLFPVALSDSNGTARLYLDVRGSMGASSLHHDHISLGEKSADVTLMKMDTFVAATGQVPAFIKIDVEGHEPHVIRGGWQTISQHRPPIVFEFHEVRWKLGFEKLFDSLEPLYNFTRLEDGAACLNEYRRGHFHLGMANIACLPR